MKNLIKFPSKGGSFNGIYNKTFFKGLFINNKEALNFHHSEIFSKICKNNTLNHLNQFNSTFFKINKAYVHSSNIFDPSETSNSSKIGEVVLTTKHGVNVLLDPLLNKGTGFTLEERERLNIRGLLPPRLFEEEGTCLDWQEKKVMIRFRECQTNLIKYMFLTSLQDRNEVLFYKCISNNLEEIAPIIYTPTVGEACINFATLFRRPRGMYFSSQDKNNMHAMTYNWPTDDVELIVVTDGSRILGLGDLGANGMGISIGKLSLYTACAGIHPSKCLPVVIDVGTNNQDLLDNKLYLGLNQRRLVGEEYMEIVDEFLRSVHERFPKALIQFEDFSTENAANILKLYRSKYLCFNDDMQGTATVTLAGLLSALKFIGYEDPQKELTKQRIVVCGAGSAGLGVARGILYNMMLSGVPEDEAYKRFWVLDNKGLIGNGRRTAFSNQMRWLREEYPDKMDLEQVVKEVKPTILLGLTGVGGIFSEKVIKEMAKNCEKPIIFPLSNPTTKAECTAENAYIWTQGRCIFASGSPFKEVILNGVTYKPAQSNNMYTYPGLGLGALAGEATMITDNMLNAAALALVDSITEDDYKDGRIFPKIQNIPKISKSIAFSVAKQAYKDSVVKYKEKKSEEELIEKINKRFWKPNYGSLVRIDQNRY